MNLRIVSRDEWEALPNPNMGSLEALIAEFKAMDVDVVEVEKYTHKSAASACASISAACKRQNCGVECKMRDGKVFLIRQNIKEGK